MLILVLAGVKAGFQEMATGYILRSGADLWVAQEGTTDMFHSFSILPLDLAGPIAAIEGVASVSPLILRQMELRIGDGHADAAVVGHKDLGGPWRMAKGTDAAGPGEVVVDKVLAANNGLDVGDESRRGRA